MVSMELREERTGAVAVVAVVGRVDSNTSPELIRALSTTIASGAARLVLDLTATQYLSSAGLRVLLQVAKQIEQVRGRFVLHGLNARVREVLDVSGFLSELTICADRHEALAVAGA
jgi:anti-anti-sigma factor